MTTRFHTDLGELKGFLAVSDYSRLSRRVLDFVYEYDLPDEFWSAANFIRASYYKQSELETAFKTGHEYDELSSNAARLLEQIATIDSSTITAIQFPASNDPVYLSSGISKIFRTGSEQFWLQPVDVRMYYGQITGVVGENGNGKTTLLRMVSGELMPDSGNATYFLQGQNLSTEWYRIKSMTGFMPQRIDRWYGTLYENLAFFATIRNIPVSENTKYVEYVLHRLGLMQFRNHKWTEISSGYRLRFELAKMLLLRPRLLILDEPLANLDINAQQLLLEDLRYIAKSQRHPISILLSSQQLHEVERVADRLIFLRKGKILFNDERNIFGASRERNSFELEGDFSRNDLEQIFTKLEGVSVEATGTIFILSVPVEIKGERVLADIVNAGKKISYYRDISTSSRKLFQKEF